MIIWWGADKYGKSQILLSHNHPKYQGVALVLHHKNSDTWS